MLIRWLPFLLVSLAVSVPAQEKPGRTPSLSGVSKDGGQSPDDPKQAESEGVDGPGKPGDTTGPVIMSPRGKCRFDVSVHPERLMPGQSGVVKIVMVLEGDAVMEVPASLAISVPGANTALQVGPMTLRPPQPGYVATAYRGRQVYDNYALAEVPVTMSPQAIVGSKQSLSLQADFQLHEGATGRLLGSFGQRLSVLCEVGEVADPSVRIIPRSQPAAGSSTAGQADVPPESGPESGLEAAGPEDGAGDAVRAADAGAAGRPESASSRVVEPRSTQDMPMPGEPEASPTTIIVIASGGVLAILVLILALARKR